MQQRRKDPAHRCLPADGVARQRGAIRLGISRPVTLDPIEQKSTSVSVIMESHSCHAVKTSRNHHGLLESDALEYPVETSFSCYKVFFQYHQL